ncbi:hypothetical protein Csa_013121 [Cucumis sativus]|uniref:Uncharacterized protein n=1 Tax=Cucumis sativus TaxID=3659 RepID=A0A0A0LS79_CUCSA|nr:hypothetical protein Csa_013121 [Cucumis sativus]
MHATYAVVKQESARMENSYMVLSLKPLVHLMENRVQGWSSARERRFVLSKHKLKRKQDILLRCFRSWKPFTITIYSLSCKEVNKLLSYFCTSNLRRRNESLLILFATRVVASSFPIYCHVNSWLLYCLIA